MDNSKCMLPNRFAMSMLALAFAGLLLMAGCGNNGNRTEYSTHQNSDEPFCITPELKEALEEYSVQSIGDGIVIVEKENKNGNMCAGCMDMNGKMILPARYSSLYSVKDDILIARDVEKTGNLNFGVIDLKGKVIIPFKYEVLRYIGDYYIAKKDGKFGVLDMNGKTLIPFQYDLIDFFYKDSGCTEQLKEKQETVLNLERNGDVEVVNLTRKQDPNFGPHEERPDDYQRIKRNGKYGYVNYLGEEIPCQYQQARQRYSEGIAAVVQNNKIGFIDKNGNVEIPFRFEYQEVPFYYYEILGYAAFSEGYAAMRLGNKFGYIDRQGEVVIPYVYDEVSSFHEGSAIVMKKINGRDVYGMIDKSNNMILPFEFECGLYQEHVFIMMQNGKYGLYTPQGKCLTPCQYDQLDYIDPDGYATVQKNGKQGLIDNKGREIIPCQYKWCSYIRSIKMVYVSQNDKVSVLDLHNNKLVPDELKVAGVYNNGFFVVEKDGKRGLYDRCGNCTLD